MGDDASVTTRGDSLGVEPFSKGSRVEVSSDEEGFKGAWYIATILDPNPKKKPGQVHVEYQSLLEDEDGKKALREFVNLGFIRPVPPPEPEGTRRFQLYDAVDALYREGWWNGVIVRVLEGDRFVVSFQNPPDLIEFGAEELRVHREWDGEKWIRPGKGTAGLTFSKGEKVEVCFDKDEYSDVWFQATVVGVLSHSYLVEYRCGRTNNGSEPLKVVVDLLHIRPYPPDLKDTQFVVGEKVDVYYDYSWWIGVITKKHENGRYTVYFRPDKMEVELNHSDTIRPHMEWKDGNWFSASQENLDSSDRQRDVGDITCNVDNNEVVASLVSLGTDTGSSDGRPASSVNLTDNQIEQSLRHNEKACNAMILVDCNSELPIPDTDDQDSQPSKKLKEADATDGMSLTCQLNTAPMDTVSEDAYFGFVTSNEDTGTNGSEQPIIDESHNIKADDDFSRGKRARSKRYKPFEMDKQDSVRGKPGRPPKSPMSGTQAVVGGKRAGELDSQTPDPLGRKVGRPPKSPMSGTQASAGDKIEDTAAFSSEKFDEKESTLKEVSITFNLDHEEVNCTQRKEPHQIPRHEPLKVLEDQSHQLHEPSAGRVKEGNQPGVGGESTSRRKRGRPRKFPAKSHEASAEVNQQNGGLTSVDVVIKDCIRNDAGSLKVTEMEAISVEPLAIKEYPELSAVDCTSLNGSVLLKSNSSNTMKCAKEDGLQNGKTMRTSDKQLEKHSSRRGRRRTISVNAQSPVQDHQEVSAGKSADVSEMDTLSVEDITVDQLPSNMSDDQPLCTWIGGMQSPKTADATSVYHDRNVERCAEAARSEKDVFMQSPVRDNTGDVLAGDNQILPFVKGHSLWKNIETMEVFQKMPQNPHFRPLESSKENIREGLAIGYMVNFSTVAEQTSSLQLDCSRSVIEDNLETLLELEHHGFDVKLLRDRLTGLLLMKDEQEEVLDRAKESTSQVGVEKKDISRLVETIAEIKKKMSMLQEDLALAESMKEKKEAKISHLESAVEHNNNEMSSLRLRFKALATAPW